MNKLIAIAVNSYSDPLIRDLKNCVNDVNAVIDILTQRYHIDEIELFSSFESTTLTALYHNLYDLFINSMEEDSILVYYAGHGEYHSVLGTSYWMCSDTQKNNLTTWLSNDLVSKLFKVSPAKHIALISDSCFSGAIFDKSRGGGAMALHSKISRQALTSGGIETVSDGMGEHSLFNLSVQKVLRDNYKTTLSFYEFAEKVILDFDPLAGQSPDYGSLYGAGHKGGSFSLRLREKDSSISYQDVQLSLQLPKEVKISGSVKIPFFNEHARFRNTIINRYIQSLGYSIVNEVRDYVMGDLEYVIAKTNLYKFEIEVNYAIEYFDDQFLSIQFKHYSDMGGIHPNYYCYGLNFSFDPERVVPLYDIVNQKGYLTFRSFLEAMIIRYAHEDSKAVLKQCLNDFDYHDLPYTFTEKHLKVFWQNELPHAFKALGELTIPIKKIDKELGKLYFD